MLRRYHESSKRPGGQLAYQVRTEDGVLVDESPVSARWTTCMVTVP